MKIQDIVFIILILFLIYKSNPKWGVLAGVISILLSIPLFANWIFFTADRLVWYSAAFFFLSVVLFIWKSR